MQTWTLIIYKIMLGKYKILLGIKYKIMLGIKYKIMTCVAHIQITNKVQFEDGCGMCSISWCFNKEL